MLETQGDPKAFVEPESQEGLKLLIIAAAAVVIAAAVGQNLKKG